MDLDPEQRAVLLGLIAEHRGEWKDYRIAREFARLTGRIIHESTVGKVATRPQKRAQPEPDPALVALIRQGHAALTPDQFRRRFRRCRHPGA